MGNMCGCNAKNNSSGSILGPSMSPNPLITEIQFRLKLLDTKVTSNLTTIEDFKNLLMETKKEHIPH